MVPLLTLNTPVCLNLSVNYRLHLQIRIATNRNRVDNIFQIIFEVYFATLKSRFRLTSVAEMIFSYVKANVDIFYKSKHVFYNFTVFTQILLGRSLEIIHNIFRW